MNNPKISVVTVCYNAVDSIKETMLSVLNQTYDNIEYIIIDGGSKDGTVDIIKKYSDRLAYWISEPDMGIYDAMNKGIDNATGDYIIFINIGDKLLNIPVNILNNELRSSNAGVCGAIIDENNKIFYPRFNWLLKLQNQLPHQGLFYKLVEIKTFKYNLRYKIVSDYELNLRLYTRGRTILTTDNIISYHDNAGISRTQKSAQESFMVIKLNLGFHWYVLSFIYRKLKALINRFIKND